MMHVTISEATLARLASTASLPYVDNAHHNGDGTATLELEDDVYERLIELYCTAPSLTWDNIFNILLDEYHDSERRIN